MKKVLFIMITLVFIAALSACGNDVITPKTISQNEGVTIAAHVNKLITNGSQLLDQTLDSYPVLGTLGLRTDVKNASDFMLFPFNKATGKPFNDRMKDIYWDKDNLVKGYVLLQQATNGTSASPSILRSKNVSRGAIGDAAENITDFFLPGVSDFCDSLFGTGGPSNEDLERQLTQIGKNLAEMHNEMKRGFTALTRKTDQILGELETVKGDLNILIQGQTDIENLILSTGMGDVKDAFEGFLGTYEMSINQTEASNKASEYVYSADYNEGIIKFITFSKALQEWATNETQYSEYIWNDPSASTNSYWVQIGTISHSHGYTNMMYHNPKKDVVISLGNMMYLAKMMLTRFQLNNVLYTSKTDRAASNRNIATYYLELLDTRGIKPALVASLEKLQARRDFYKGWADQLYVPVWGAGAHAGAISPAFMYKKNGAGGQLLGTFSASTSGWNYSAAYNVINNHLNNQLAEYFGLIVAKLVALEVQLKSYL